MVTRVKSRVPVTSHGQPARAPAHSHRAEQFFGLWRVRFPPCLVRPGRRLPVQGLSEGRNLDGFRGLYTETRLGPETFHRSWDLQRFRPRSRLPSQPPQLVADLCLAQLSASANAKRNPTPAKPSAPSCATALFSNRSQKDCSVRDPRRIAESRGFLSALAQPGSHTIQTRGLNRSLIRLRDPIKDPTDV